jgi:dTDP-4-amino-4,6-dideoxygalactose transaminase
MAVTNCAKLASKMQLLRGHGITRDKDLMSNQLQMPSWYYEQQILGFNYRLTDIQAALGISQFNRLDGYINKRAEIANEYTKSLNGLPLQLPLVNKNCYSAWHLYILRINGNPNMRNQIFESLKERNIHANLHYIPVHLQPYYKQLGDSVGYNQESFPESLRYYQEAITLPIYPLLSKADQQLVIELVKKELVTE